MTYNTNRQSTTGRTTGAFDRTGERPQGTFEQAQDKAEQIAGDVRETAQQAIDQVTQNFDLNQQVAQRPWLLFGAAMAAGYLLGNLGGGGGREEYWYNQRATMPYSPSSFSYGQGAPAAAMQQAQQYESSQREGTMGKLGRKLFSNLGSLEDLFREHLQDLYDAEHQILKALPKMIEAASSPELKRAFELHLQQTQGQIRRLEQVFDQLGAKPQGKICAAMQGLIVEGEELMAMRADPTVMDAGLIAAAQRVEHYEIAGYGCLRTWARQLGFNQVVGLLQQTLDEEERTDKQLTQIAERAVNVKAAES